MSRVRLVKADGSEVPVTLTQDGLWQVDDVALLDFENATGACANGTEETRDVVEGTVPAGRLRRRCGSRSVCRSRRTTASRRCSRRRST